jgi:hypothetical protein
MAANQQAGRAEAVSPSVGRCTRHGGRTRRCMVHRYGHWRLSSPARESCIAGRRWRPITNISISGQVLRTFMAKSFLNLAHRPGFKTIWPSHIARPASSTQHQAPTVGRRLPTGPPSFRTRDDGPLCQGEDQAQALAHALPDLGQARRSGHGGRAAIL